MHSEFFDLLHTDHQEVDQILMKIEKANPNSREDLLNQLNEEITPHMRGEDKALYPRLLDHKESKKDAQEALKEHDQARETLKTLMVMSPSSKEWMGTFRQLREQIQHHVEDEESKVFDDARKVFSEEDMDMIMKDFKREKQRTKLAVK